MSRRVWLVRHGETEGQSSVRYHGSNDVPLSDLGRAQIRALSPLFAGLQPSRILCSPLSRARESAAILAASQGWNAAAIGCDERLREISFGACEGLTQPEIAARHPEFWRLHQAGKADAFPGGEPFAGFASRVRAAALEAEASHQGGDLVIVAHRGIVRAALRTLLRVPEAAPDPHPGFKVRLGSLSVACDEGGWQAEMLDFVP